MKRIYRQVSVLLTVLMVASCSGGGGGGGGGRVATGTATLSWTAPVLNDDGSTLNDLVGFKVKYGTSSGTYTQIIDVPNAAAVTYSVTGLPAGATYYFAVTAYNNAGVESDPSNEGSKTLP